MMPLVRDYLLTHTLQQLEDEHGVLARPNKKFDKLSLNYDQIMVKNGDQLAEQCRGMVIRPVHRLDEADFKNRVVGEVTILAWPMNRFYNHGDPAGAEIDWGDSQLRVYEKLDGTMIVCYWDAAHNRWHAATRAVPEADLPIRGGHMEIGDMTFSELFFRTLSDSQERDGTWSPFDLDPEVTYVFELTSPFNRVVVKYDTPQITLLAARHTTSGREIPIESIGVSGVATPKAWLLTSVTALDAFVNSADPAVLEGAVVCDSQFRRLKVKNKAWVLSSRAKDLVTVSRRSALEAIIAGTVDDVLPIVDADIADELRRMQTALRDYLKKVDINFATWKAEAGTNRKRFAELVCLSGDWATPYFQLIDGKGSGALDWAISAQESGRLSPRVLDTLLEKIGCPQRK